MIRKYKLSLTALAAAVVPVLAVSVVTAQANQPLTTSQSSSQSNTSQQTTTQNADQKQQLTERLQKRKAQLNTKLTAVQQTRIKERCKNAQGLITSAVAKFQQVEKARLENYENLLQKLNAAEAKLAKEGVSTVELKVHISVLQFQIDTFMRDVATYKQALSDTKDVDCVIDPIGFKSSLEESRTGIASLKQDAAEIRTHLSTKVKPALTAAISQLSKTQEAN